VSIRDGVKRYYENFGLRGILTVSSHRLLGRPRTITARRLGIQHPVQLRLRTSDILVYGDILLRGQYGFDLRCSPSVIIDAGANIGLASIYFAHKYPKAKIIAIEPEASNFALLTKNVGYYSTIVPVHAALWNYDGEISVSEPDPATGAGGKWAFVTHEGSGDRVRAITVRTLMEQMKIDRIDLLKVDIEGAEKEVFEACDWIDCVDCLMIELHDWFKPGCTDAVASVVQGFSRVRRGETTIYVREQKCEHTDAGCLPSA
jgi:FkbM family methyltransferase